MVAFGLRFKKRNKMTELVEITIHYLPKGHLLEGTDDYCVYLKDIEKTTKEVMIPRKSMHTGIHMYDGINRYNEFTDRENFDLEEVVNSEIPKVELDEGVVACPFYGGASITKVELIEENAAFEFSPINSELINDYYNSFEAEIEAIGAQEAFEGHLEGIFNFVKKRLEERNNEIVTYPRVKRELIDLTKYFQYTFTAVFHTYTTGHHSYWGESEYEYHFDFLGALDVDKIVNSCLIKAAPEEELQCKSS